MIDYIYWVELSWFHQKTEMKSSLQVLYKRQDRTVENVQNCDSYISIPSSQAYRFCLRVYRSVLKNCAQLFISEA
jgi:hypothetical protein